MKINASKQIFFSRFKIIIDKNNKMNKLMKEKILMEIPLMEFPIVFFFFQENLAIY